MALDKEGLKSALKTMMTQESPTSVDDAVDALASAIETYVKSGTVTGSVTITNVLVAPPGGGPVTGTSSGSMSNGTIS